MKKPCLFIIVVCFSLMAGAVDNLRIPNLRTLSLGGGGVTETPLYNPALLADLTQHQLFANYYNRYSVSELGTVSGGFYFKNSIVPAGFEISSFGYDAYRESLFRFCLGKKIAAKWNIGIAVQYMLLQSELFEETSGRISADVGISYKPVENVLIGVSALHLPSVKVGEKAIENEHITPYSIQAGFNWQVMNTLLITASADHCKEATLSGSFGMEYLPFDNFMIRAGLRSSPLKPSLGVGYRFSALQIDAGMLYHETLGISMGFGFSYSF